eukprot:TRINITY_DN8779_c0_g1_i1.p1 TRINITY_DN8779_c0_g1~~TRINITY_DN8779_c0_g1_i1.p1  ORF type:complete len:264 (+),score=14.89 TRINITY_DN8779_c0_g1_i1:206-997(+)
MSLYMLSSLYTVPLCSLFIKKDLLLTKKSRTMQIAYGSLICSCIAGLTDYVWGYIDAKHDKDGLQMIDPLLFPIVRFFVVITVSLICMERERLMSTNLKVDFMIISIFTLSCILNIVSAVVELLVGKHSVTNPKAIYAGPILICVLMVVHFVEWFRVRTNKRHDFGDGKTHWGSIFSMYGPLIAAEVFNAYALNAESHCDLNNKYLNDLLASLALSVVIFACAIIIQRLPTEDEQRYQQIQGDERMPLRSSIGHQPFLGFKGV